MTAGQRLGPQNPYIAGGDGPEWFLSPPRPASSSSEGDSGGGLLGGGDLLGGLLG
jgi:hypothetical protein